MTLRSSPTQFDVTSAFAALSAFTDQCGRQAAFADLAAMS